MDKTRIKHIIVVLFISVISAFHTVSAQAGTLVEYRIYEELPPDTLIGNVVDDAELGRRYSPAQLQELRFSFLEQPDSERPLFAISQRNGVLRTLDQIDRDMLCPEQPQCHVFLDVAVGPAQYFQVINLRVSIQDINDNKPMFPQKEMTLQISEAALPGATVSVPAATDPDSEKYSIQYYELVADTDKFRLTESKGLDGSVDLQLALRGSLDREQVGNYQVTILAHDGGTPPRLGSLLINITIADANDNNPVFANTTFEAYIPEDSPLNRTVTRVLAYDADTGDNGRIVYGYDRRTQSSFGDRFGIRAHTGEIYLKKALDFEKETIYHLGVTAKDSGPDSQVARATVVLHVQDVNDNAPQITVNTLTSTGEAQISEASPISTFVSHISAADQDGGKNGELSCSLHSENFFLEHLYKTQYKVVTATLLDREARSRYDITITCQDLGTPPKTTTEIISITVLDENDHSPVFAKQLYTVDIDENNMADAYVAQVNATDLDIGNYGKVEYSILPGEHSNQFKIHPLLGIIRAKEPLDHEQVRLVKLQVQASDHGKPPRSSTTMVMVTINDKNDEAPYFIQPAYSLSVYENRPPGEHVGIVSAADPDTAPYNQVEFAIQRHGGDDKFEIDPYSGEITTTTSLDREAVGVHYLTITASNPGYPGLSTSVTASIYVVDENDNDPVITFPNPLNNTVLVSNKASLGSVVCRIIAYDEDISTNKELNFDIKNDRDGLFDIDAGKGAITVDADLSSIINGFYQIDVLVSDRGDPIRVARTKLNIYVNNSAVGDLQEAQKSTSFLSGTNRTIVISLAAASAVVVLALCVAIVIIKSYDKKERTSEPLEHKTEAQSMLPPPGDKDSPDGGQSFHTISRDSTAEKPVKKEVSFTIDVNDSKYPLDHRGSPNKTANSTQGHDTSSHQVPNQVGFLLYIKASG